MPAAGPSEVVPRLRHGDSSALAELYAMHRRAVYHVIARIVPDPSAAEDLVQETFLRLWHSCGCLDPHYETVMPWLMTIARNCALDYRKSAASKWLRYEDLLQQALPANDLEQTIAAEESARILFEAFQRLPADQREVVDLAYFEGYSHTAIAEFLKQPLGTVKGRLRLALAKLRAAVVCRRNDRVRRGAFGRRRCSGQRISGE